MLSPNPEGKLRVWVKDSPGLYRPHTVNTPRVVGAHTPFLYITAIVSLRREIQCLWSGSQMYMSLCSFINCSDLTYLTFNGTTWMSTFLVWNLQVFAKKNKKTNSWCNPVQRHNYNMTKATTQFFSFLVHNLTAVCKQMLQTESSSIHKVTSCTHAV